MSVNAKLLICEDRDQRDLVVEFIMSIELVSIRDDFEDFVTDNGIELGRSRLIVYPEFYEGDNQPEVEVTEDCYGVRIKYLTVKQIAEFMSNKKDWLKETVSTNFATWHFLCALSERYLVCVYFD